MAGFERRFEIGDKFCGVIGYRPFRMKALEFARRMTDGLHKNCPTPTVFDRMAHQGAPSQWRPDGRCIAHRHGG